MENKDLQGTLLSQEPGGVKPIPNALHTPPSESSALSEPTGSQMLISQEQPPSGPRRFLRFARRVDVILAVLLLLAGAVVLFNVFNNRDHQKESLQPTGASNFGTVKIPLEELVSGKDLSLSGAANVTINGSMQLNNALLLSPSLQPTGAKPGQLYYDQTTNQLAYYNGQVFVFLTAPTPETGGVQSLGGATGQLTLGSGLSLTNGQLNNSGVLSVQGQNGNVTFTAGPGLVINGTTFSNSGVLSVASGSPNVSVVNDGNGGVTVSVTSGAGTITSSGGTAGRVPLYTASQNIEDSIISQSGLTVTINGDLSVITGGLSLSNALTVSNGGTGATSFSNNGVLVGQGTAPVTAVTAGGTGLCLMSTAGLPTWAACPGATGVTSLNSLSGALTIANASAAGSTITIDDASTSNKGIASFNPTNFSVTSGTVNTVQNINTGATPTFAGLNTNNITPSAALTVGSTNQALTLQGNATTTLTATNGANTTALSFITPTANVTYRLQTATAGTYDICTTAGNCVSGGVTSPGGTTNRLAKFTGAQVIGDSIIVDNGTNVDVGGTLSVQGVATFVGDIAVNGGDITSTGALNITPAGTLTVGVSGQQLTLQGNASTSLTAVSGGNTTALTFQTPTANVVYRLPTATAGSYDVCTTAGNCVGSGGGVTTSGGTTNRLAKFSGTQTINDSTISDDGTNVTTSVDLVIQGGDVTVGVANSQTGSIRLAHSGSAFTGTFLQGALTADRTYTLPDANGTICLTSGNCSGAGSPNTLQAAYDAGNTIATTTARDLAIILADSAADANFVVTAATGATGYVGIVRADGAGTADPAQLLLLDNLDTDRVQPTGLRIQSAGGGLTTAIDVSDAEIVTAINIGANDILGTTGNIDLSNFDVIGATGNVTAAGTINGQTISSAANFTGTVAIAGNATLASDLAVNGGDITSTGALNITPGGTMTVGATGQQLVLQGNANTQLTATGGGFTTTVGFAGSPTGAVTYNFDRAATAGTYTICTTIGNCTGTGGGVTTPGGTTGTIAKFTGAQTLGDSLLAESGTTVTVNGNLNLVSGNQFQVNGTQISSANLSNDANLAKLNASQTFTGNMNAFQNGTNSTNAFNVQNAAGQRIVTVDSSNAQLILGTASTVDGRLAFRNVSNGNTITIIPGTPSADRTLTLPDASGVLCTDSGNCAGAGATLQTAYNFSVGGTTPKIKVNSSLGGVDIQDADTPIGANLLNIRASNGAGLGSVLFGVGNTGAATLQNSTNSTTAFRLLTAGGTTVLTGDTTNGQILLGQSSTLSGAIVFRNATNSNTITLVSGAATTGRTVTLPDADGTICLTSGNCSGAGSPNTLQAAYDAGNTITSTSARDLSFTLADSATDANFTIDIASGSTGFAAIRRADGSGTNDPSQMVLIENLDTDRVQPTALRIQAAAGGITTAIDLSDPEILTAFNTGANDITGTGYSIAGATGNITTSGDLAVNGGDITSTGALNITPSGTLTVGVAGQQIILQGNASTQLIANGGGFATTIGFTGTPTGNVNYNFDRASTSGTYTICTTAAVCGGYQSPLTFNNGLTNTSGTVQLGGSLIQNTTIATGLLGLNLTSDLTSGNRNTPVINITQANGANISLQPLLSVTNSDTNSNLDLVSFTHNPSSAGVVLSLNGSSSTGLQVNTTAGTVSRGVDVKTQTTTGIGVRVDSSALTSGQGISIEGSALSVLPAFTGSMLQIAPTKQLIGGSGTLTDTGNYLKVARSNTMNSAGRTWNNTGDLAVFSSNCTQTAGTCSDSGRIMSLNQQYASATGAVLSVQNAGSGNLLELGNASTILAKFSSNGNLTLGSTSTAGQASLTDGTGNAFTNSLVTTTLTANRTITLPDATGTVCLQSSSACGFVTGSASSFIQNQNSISQSADWRITGTGRADTALQAPVLDTATAVALNIGSTNATAINLQQNTTLASGKSLTLQGAFTMTPSADGTSIFNVRTSAGNNMFTIDTQNARVGIGLGSTNVPTLSNAGIEIKGAIRLSGANGTYSDAYTTPLGGTVNTLINIANYNPGASAQLIALGLPSNADTNSRALSLFDARSGAHQPTLAVLSPDQNQIAGFSWEGSIAGTNGIDSIFYTKTSTNNMRLQANNLNILTLQNVSSVARVGIGNTSPGYALDVNGDANISSGSAYKINGTDICTSGGCVPVATCSVTGNYLCNGGNTPVSSVAVGTTNAQPLNFLTNGTTRATISSAGIFQVLGNGTGSARIGGDCSSNYTAINLGGTTPFDCTSYNLLSGPTDTSLYINRPSGSSVFIREGNASTNHLSIAGGGAFTAQNTTDTTAGFRVLNAGSVPLFQINTTDSRVYIGNPTGDTTGALLVLDTKTDASDPTAVDGGMYFNSFYKRLRCYYDGQWRFCNDPVGLTYGFNLEEDFIGGGPDIGTHNWTQSPLGSGSITPGVAPDSGLRPGQITLALGTVGSGTNYATLFLNGNSAEPIILGNTNGTRIEIEFAANIPTLSAAGSVDYDVHMGLCDDFPSNGCQNGIYFEYDRDQSTNWRYGAANGGSRTLTNSSTAVATGWHRYKMIYTYSTTGPTATIEFYVDGTLIGTHTNTNVPTTNSTQPQFDIMRDTGGSGTVADRTLILDYFQYRSSFTSAR